MPIVIVKGSDSIKKKNVIKSSSSEDLLKLPPKSQPSPKKGYDVSTNDSTHTTAAEKIDQINSNMQKMAGDMTDILDFKLYRIIKSSFYEPVSRTILVGGELFYDREEVNKVLVTDGDEHREAEAVQPVKSNKPTVLQRIREMKYTAKKTQSVDRNHKDILMHVKTANDRTKQIRSGHSLKEHLELPTVEKTIEWTVSYVNTNEHELTDTFIQFEEKLRAYEKRMEDKLKSQQQQQSSSSPTSHSTNKGPHSPSNGNSDLDLFADAGAALVHSRFKPSEAMANNGKVTTSGSSTTANKQSLAAQLENLKLSGTDAFLNQIIAVPPPTLSGGPNPTTTGGNMNRRSSKGGVAFKLKGALGELHSTDPQSGKKPQAARKVGGPPAGSAPNHAHRVLRKVSSGAVNPPSSSSNSEAFSAAQSPSGNHQLNYDERPSSSQDATGGTSSPNRTRARTRTSSNTDSFATDDNSESQFSPKSPSPAKMPPGPPPSRGKSSRQQNRPAASRVYTNATAEDQQVSSSLTMQQIQLNNNTKETTALLELRRSQKLYEQTMGYTASIFDQVTMSTKKMQSKIEGKLRKGNRSGQRVVRQWLAFSEVKTNQRQNMTELCETKAFFRPSEMLDNIDCFEMDGFERGNKNNKLGINIAKDMKYMRRNAAKSHYHKTMSRLLAAKWFHVIVIKTRDYMRRLNNNIPVCCLKFLTCFKYLISYDYTLTKDTFYTVLERTVVVKEDYIRNIVHVVLRAARDALSITPEEFLLYHEAQDIQPCPELLNQIRTANQSALGTTHNSSHNSHNSSQNQSRAHSPRPRDGPLIEESTSTSAVAEKEGEEGEVILSFSSSKSPRGGARGGLLDEQSAAAAAVDNTSIDVQFFDALLEPVIVKAEPTSVSEDVVPVL